MATLDNSPSLFLGQPWTAWADRLPIQDREAVDGAEQSVSEEVDPRAGPMRLRKEDMSCFGICPSKDDFYLAVCEHCGQVIKPQALENHMALRHANAPSLPTPTPSPVLSFSNNSPVCSNSSSCESNAGTPQKPHSSTIVQSDNVKHKDVNKMIITAKPTIGACVRTPSPQNAKLTSTPPSTPKTMPSQTKKNYTSPVVKMERSSRALEELANLKKSQTMTDKKNNIATNNNNSDAINGTSSSKNSTPTNKSTSKSTPPSTKSGSSTSKNSQSGKSATPTSKSTTPKSSSTTKKNSPRKLLPCKDREFDANKHCGVWLSDIQKHCTRSLTCKTHALSLRRGVAGRRKPFDDLLLEHRARREKEMQLVNEAKLLQQKKSQQSANNKTSTDESANKIPSPSKSSNSLTHKRPLPSTPTGVLSHSLNTATSSTDNKLGSDAEIDGADETDNLNCPYTNHHPKPAAVCTFGARLMGRGCYVFNRKSDYVRSSLMSLVERHLHPPPFKKMCISSLKTSTLGSPVTQAVPVDKGLPTYSTAISAMSGNFTPIMANGPLNKTQNSSKKSKSNSKQGKSKDGLSASMSKSKSRRKSGSNSTISQASVMPGLTTTSNSLAPLTIPLQSGSGSGFNINTATYPEMGQNAILSSSTGNLIKDLSIVVTNIDANVNNGLTPGQVINGVNTGSPHVLATNTGQIVTSNIGQLAAVNNAQARLQFHTTVPITTTAQLANLSSANFHASIGSSMQGNVICTMGDMKQSSVPVAKAANANKTNARSRNKSGKQSNTTRIHAARQGSMASSNLNRTDSSFDTTSSGPPSAQPSPGSMSMTPSPNFRPGSISPQISVQSPLPNGIIPSPSAINLKVNHFPTVTISPSRNSTPSPITITSSTEASPNNSGHFNSSMFTQTGKSSSAARANTNFQKQIYKQHQSLTSQQSPMPQLQTQHHQLANIVAASQIFPNMQQLQPNLLKQESGKAPPSLTIQPVAIRLPIQQSQPITIPQPSSQPKTIESHQLLLRQSDETM
ncbi:uncharacterized protein LOC102807102 [Saccoglossus kowalevskii]|uniref:Ataxin-7-like protein 1-like n=1 Tax=Saccoglossus kowalevskii TaxID=10224 RepID=A0ABM0M7J4_SACKO|nr:PREDICTED: ataxin-7-like protein 1-like [Saccoglossus kowalevskii]